MGVTRRLRTQTINIFDTVSVRGAACPMELGARFVCVCVCVLGGTLDSTPVGFIFQKYHLVCVRERVSNNKGQCCGADKRAVGTAVYVSF